MSNLRFLGCGTLAIVVVWVSDLTHLGIANVELEQSVGTGECFVGRDLPLRPISTLVFHCLGGRSALQELKGILFALAQPVRFQQM